MYKHILIKYHIIQIVFPPTWRDDISTFQNFYTINFLFYVQQSQHFVQFWLKEKWVWQAWKIISKLVNTVKIWNRSCFIFGHRSIVKIGHNLTICRRKGRGKVCTCCWGVGGMTRPSLSTLGLGRPSLPIAPLITPAPMGHMAEPFK